jgi:hypothetical protein
MSTPGIPAPWQFDQTGHSASWPSPGPGINANGSQDYRSLDDPLPDRINLMQVEAIDHERNEERSKDSAPYPTLTAGYGRPPYNDGRDDSEQEAEVIGRHCTDRSRCRNNTSKSSSGPGESEHGDCHPSDTNPGKPRSLRVATGGVDMATEPRP